MTDKTELRRRLRQTRLELDSAESALKSRQIVKRLKAAMDWSAVDSLHYFEPLLELLEVDISDFITGLEDNYLGLQMTTSRLISGTWQLVSVRSAPPPDKFDVIIVPALGFDTDLHRVGYGGGYYDRFLATQPQAQKIGVCFESGKVDHIPAEPHDISLDIIITESETYS